MRRSIAYWQVHSADDALHLREDLLRATRGVELDHVERLEEALLWLAGRGIDAVLLDPSLANVAGVDGVERLRAARRELAIVVLAGASLFVPSRAAQNSLAKNEPAQRARQREASARANAELRQQELDALFIATADPVVVSMTDGSAKLANPAAVELANRDASLTA